MTSWKRVVGGTDRRRQLGTGARDGRIETGHGGDEVLLGAVEPSQPERVDPRGGALGGEPLELGAQLVDLLHLAAGRGADDRAAVRAQRHQAGALELGQRLTDRGPADLETGAQLVLREAFAERDPAVEDVALQAMGDLVGEARRRGPAGTAETDIVADRIHKSNLLGLDPWMPRLAPAEPGPHASASRAPRDSS